MKALTPEPAANLMADCIDAMTRSNWHMGRDPSGVLYAIAREGTLKLKGISYAHVEGYPARQKVIRNRCNCRAGFCVASSARELLLVIVEVIPLQLFAYHIATQKGYDVDHKRNLVKAVVTE